MNARFTQKHKKYIWSIRWNTEEVRQNIWRTSYVGNKEGVVDENVGPAAAEEQ